MASEDVKPGQETVNISIKEGENGPIMFKVKRSIKFEKIFAAFAAKKGAQLNAYKFMKDGEQVKNDDTPDGIGLEDGDQLDAILNQQGGSAGGQC